MEGPFISAKKKGAHPEQHIVGEAEGIETMQDVFGSLDNVKIITLAPEIPNVLQSIPHLVDRGIVVSVGQLHSSILWIYWNCYDHFRTYCQ